MEYKISIICTSYNHEPYIRQTLEGLVMQQCDSPFEIIVHDDASTDNTITIIREYEAKYPHLFRIILQTENQYSQGVNIWQNLFTDPKCGEYIAICEGDDYWIDPLKLQKQVEFLDANPDYGMIYSRAKCYKQSTGRFVNEIGNGNNTFDSLLVMCCIPTLTTMFRKELYQNFVKEIAPSSHNWKMGDYPLWLYLSCNSKIHFIDEVTSVYRLLDNSASHHTSINGKIAFLQSCNDVCDFFLTKYTPVSLDKLHERQYVEMFEFACLSKDKEFRKEYFEKATNLYSHYKTTKLRMIVTLGRIPWFYLAVLRLFRVARKVLS